MSTTLRPMLGVIGGMGPLASAEFLKTIYEQSLAGREQESPAVLMYSDPDFPDRTEAFLAGREEELLARLDEVLGRLEALGASRFVICCFTIHHLLPRLPAERRRRIISLLDVAAEQLALTRRRSLLVCSQGTQALRVFQQQTDWERLSHLVVLPDEQDQARIHHEVIYELKKNRDPAESVALLESLLAKYKVDSFIVGCTEIHLLAKHFMASGQRRRRYHCIDPLYTIAKNLQ